MAKRFGEGIDGYQRHVGLNRSLGQDPFGSAAELYRERKTPLAEKG
jgi:hypothetical protein